MFNLTNDTIRAADLGWRVLPEALLPIGEWKFSYNDHNYAIKIVTDTGGNTNPFPGSGLPLPSEPEYCRFADMLEKLKNKTNPLMIELGSHWALASVFFRKLYPKGSNIILEPDLGGLSVGAMNFSINHISCEAIWGSVFPCKTEGYELLYEGYKPDFKSRFKQLDFIEDIYKKYQLHNIDVLHMDIQGSEYPLMKSLDKIGLLKKQIQSVLVATHCIAEHHKIVDILKKNDFILLEDNDRTVLHNKKTVRCYALDRKEEAYAFAASTNQQARVRENRVEVDEIETTDGLIIAYKNE